jgi:nitrite reductase/ring-hydroxylating ferredoxin subunit
MSSRRKVEEMETDNAAAASCAACPLGEALERRAFLRDAALKTVGILITLGAAASDARALPLRLLSPIEANGDERAYPLPAADGATIDREESVIVVRWQNTAYAFSLACPHQNTALKWEPQDARFQCPKHHSKYRPDGSFIEGRATRGMDRFAVRRDGERLMVDLDKLYQQNEDPAEWKAALVQL